LTLFQPFDRNAKVFINKNEAHIPATRPQTKLALTVRELRANQTTAMLQTVATQPVTMKRTNSCLSWIKLRTYSVLVVVDALGKAIGSLANHLLKG
jgi:hypothetical protein